MYAVLSPAKNLDLTRRAALIPTTRPDLLDEANKLSVTCRRLGARKLAPLMDLSDKLATLNAERFASWVPDHDEASTWPAALMFNGDTYRGLRAAEWSAEDRAWSQDHVGILSGLYGLLRPFDRVMPYRLEMGAPLHTRRGKNLYAWWGDRVRKATEARLEGHADRTLVCLASAEYWDVIGRARPRVPVLHCEFREERDGQASMISFFAKQARGAMARWIVQHRVERRDDLRGFDAEGYRFDAARSTDGTWVYVRPAG